MIVSIEGLRKVYAGRQPVVAVDGIDLEVGEGEIFGLLGDCTLGLLRLDR